jgi:hypothetical protein
MRRFRFGLLVGFALGYWFGTKAGRERHRQLEELLKRARESETVSAAADRAKDLIETGVDKGRDLVETGVEKGKGLVDHVRSDGDDADADPDADVGEPGVDRTVVTEPAIGEPISHADTVNPGTPIPEIS